MGGFYVYMFDILLACIIATVITATTAITTTSAWFCR